ncbi:pilus assembly protein TadG-related protein [Streptomyces sp. NPDC049910]|uniref:pilus assembly protein TadG-related protein n=1 Tax=Streptomyces sp. NPDC049910 TaxID=3155278 RepID=UPI0034237085
MNRRVPPRLPYALLRAGDDRGRATAFVVGIIAAMWLFAGIVVDGGLALAGKAQALDVAQEAARLGAQQLDIGQLRRSGDVRLMHNRAVEAARAHVTATGDAGSATVKGDAVTVSVTHRQPTQILQLIGVRTLTVQATGTAHAKQATP